VVSRLATTNSKTATVGVSKQESEFVATVAHELRNPLHTASGFLSFLLQDMAGPLSAMQRDMLASVATCVEQSQMLTEDLLCNAALEHGQFSLDLQPLDLCNLVHEEAHQLRLMAEAANVQLEVVNLEGKDCLVKASRLRMGQCIRNLIVNAIKFSPMGGTVRVVLKQRGPDYMISVEDEGPGIAPEYQQKIFERRFQARKEARHLAGYGLGLSISKDLVEQQGGQMGLQSGVGQGSRFYIILPGLL
jgi:two-component system, NtrC family, sensor histidine kinase KinB